MRNPKVIKPKKVCFKVNHPLYGTDNQFKSWIQLCDRTIELAMEESTRRLVAKFDDLVDEICEELLESLEEHEPEIQEG